MKNISTTKITYIFLGIFFSLLASCAGNAPPTPTSQDEALFQMINSDAGSMSRPAFRSTPDPSYAKSGTLPEPTSTNPVTSDSTPPTTNPNAVNPSNSNATPYPNPYANAAPTPSIMAMSDSAPETMPQVLATPSKPRPETLYDFSQIDCDIDENDIKEILAEVKKRKNDVIKTLPDCLKLNRSLMMRAAIINPSEFQYAADILKEDESFVHRMLEINPEILKFAATSLRLDKDFMEQATYLNRDALKYADPKLLDNKIFIREMIKIDAKNYIFASERLREIPEFAQSAFLDNGLLLEYAPTKIKDDRKLVTIAVESNADALQFASDRLKEDKILKKLAAKKTSIKEDGLKKFLRENYLSDSDKKNIGIIIDNRMKFFADNKIIDRNYITKWQRSYDPKNETLRLISADSRNFPVSWKDDFKRFPLLIQKIEKFLLNRQVDQSTIDSLSTVYFWKVKKKPQTVVFNLYLLRDSNDAELGPKFANVTSLTAIAQKRGEAWNLSVVEVIFDSEIKIDLAYENGHKQYALWDLHEVDEKDKNPKIIFKVEDQFSEYFEIFEEQNNGKYHMVQRVDSLKDARSEDAKPAKMAGDEDSF